MELFLPSVMSNLLNEMFLKGIHFKRGWKPVKFYVGLSYQIKSWAPFYLVRGMDISKSCFKIHVFDNLISLDFAIYSAN